MLVFLCIQCYAWFDSEFLFIRRFRLPSGWPRSSSTSAVALFALLVLLIVMHFEMCSFWSTNAPDARYDCRCGPKAVSSCARR